MNTYPDNTQQYTRKAVAFSGHRSFKAAARTLFSATEQTTPYNPRQLKARLREILSGLYTEGYRDFLCGMAEGFDLLAAETVLGLRSAHNDIRLIAVVPHPGQSARFDAAARTVYDRAMASAARVVTVCGSYSPDCFHRRNDYLVDNSDTLVCFFNGSRGGTAYTVRRAARSGLRIINLAMQDLP